MRNLGSLGSDMFCHLTFVQLDSGSYDVPRFLIRTIVSHSCVDWKRRRPEALQNLLLI